MKLSYENGKTIVEIDGEQMGVAKAILKFPKQAKEIVTYSKTAKKLSEMKITSFTREYSRAWNPYMADDTTTFYVNGKEIAQFRDGNVEAITTPDEKLTPETKVKVEALKAKLGIKKIDWVNGTYFANGNPMTKANYDFMQSYLSGAELNAETGKISTQVEPSFNRSDLIQENSYPYAYSVGEGVKFITDYYLDDADRHGETNADVKFRIQGKNISYETSKELHFDNGQSKQWEERGNISEILILAKVDLVNAKVGALLNDYANQKNKETELSI